jgi:ATP-binding cassette, subfamily B, bacterial
MTAFPLWKLARFLRPYRWYLAVALAGALAEATADLLQPWPLKILFDQVFSHRQMPALVKSIVSRLLAGTDTQGVLLFVLFGVVGVTVLSALGSFVQDFVMPRVGHWMMHDLRCALYWHIQRLSLAYHDERRMGDLMSTLTGDIQSVRELVESALVGLFINTLAIAGMVTIMLSMDWRFALLPLSVTPFLGALIFIFTRRIKKASRAVRKREGAVTSVAQEVLASIRVVQAFTREDYEQARFERENVQRVNAGIRARTLEAQLKPGIEIMVAVGTALVIWFGARQVLAGTLQPGGLLVFLAYVTRLYRPIKEMSKQLDTVGRATVGFERILEILETERTVADLPGARPAGTLAGGIAFEHVAFSYRKAEPALEDISFIASPGQMIAIVGSTGAGKTTLLSLIPRFHDAAKGRILLDGKDVTSYTLASVRSQMSLVLQETVLFYGSVRDNIAYGRPEASFEEIQAAAEAANADGFIRALPNGYDTLIGERGVTLSGGERQRIAIARAMIRNAPIVLLDEPTTGLDASSEALVLEALARLTQSKTSIVIAHRLSTIMRADCILVIEHGHIVERGTHHELIRQEGRYAQLARLQFRFVEAAAS